MQKKVSVIIPCYNIEKYISHCLDSIIHQTEKSIEIICVNDGSTDKTGEILEQYKKKDKRINIIESKNKGVASARNLGIKEATGEYIMFVDGDDYVDISMINDMYNYASNNNIDVVRCNRYDVYPKNNKVIERKPLWNKNHIVLKDKFKEEIYLDFLKRAKLSSVWMMLFKSRLIKDNKILFDETLKVDEDVVFSMKVFTIANSFMYLPRAYYFYVRHGNGLSSKGVDLQKRVESRKKHAKLIEDFMKIWNIYDNNIFIEKITFIAIYTAFQTCRMNKKIKFYDRYKIFKSIITDKMFNSSIEESKYVNLMLQEKILCFLIKIKLYKLSFIYGIWCNAFIDIVRPFIEKYRN